MKHNFESGQLVRISAHNQSAYGRIAIVTGANGRGRSLVRFADLPESTGVGLDLVRSFSHDDLTLIDNVLWADSYLFIEVIVYDGPFSYSCSCLTYVEDEQIKEQVVDRIVESWYEGGGVKIGERKYSFIEFDREITVECQSYQQVTLADYINLRSYVEERSLN